VASLVTFKRALDVMLTDLGKDIRPFPDRPHVRAVDREAVRDELLKAYTADTLEAKRTAFHRCEKMAQQRGVVQWFWIAKSEGR
jgi:hypothetical protein